MGLTKVGHTIIEFKLELGLLKIFTLKPNILN